MAVINSFANKVNRLRRDSVEKLHGLLVTPSQREKIISLNTKIEDMAGAVNPDLNTAQKIRHLAKAYQDTIAPLVEAVDVRGEFSLSKRNLVVQTAGELAALKMFTLEHIQEIEEARQLRIQDPEAYQRRTERHLDTKAIIDFLTEGEQEISGDDLITPPETPPFQKKFLKKNRRPKNNSF